MSDLNLPSASRLNYTDTDEVYSYFLLLEKYRERFGGLTAPRGNSPVLNSLDREAAYWLKKVERILTDGPISAVPPLLDAYDLAYRICWHRPATEFNKTVRCATVQRWLKGERTLSSTDIMLLLWPLVVSDYTTVDSRYREYCSSVYDSWMNELLENGSFRHDTPSGDVYRRLVHILGKDLFAYVAGGKAAQEKCKRKWTETYRVTDLTRLDTPTLRVYIPFAITASRLGYLPANDRQSDYNTLLAELVSRTDLHPLYREALKIECENPQKYN